LTTNDRDVCELWTEYLTWITGRSPAARRGIWLSTRRRG